MGRCPAAQACHVMSVSSALSGGCLLSLISLLGDCRKWPLAPCGVPSSAGWCATCDASHLCCCHFFLWCAAGRVRTWHAAGRVRTWHAAGRVRTWHAAGRVRTWHAAPAGQASCPGRAAPGLELGAGQPCTGSLAFCMQVSFCFSMRNSMVLCECERSLHSLRCQSEGWYCNTTS